MSAFFALGNVAVGTQRLNNCLPEDLRDTKSKRETQTDRHQIRDRHERGRAGSQQEAETDRSAPSDRRSALSVSSAPGTAINNHSPFILQLSVLPVNP